jgi:hypothetical protein
MTKSKGPTRAQARAAQQKNIDAAVTSRLKRKRVEEPTPVAPLPPVTPGRWWLQRHPEDDIED